MSVKEYVYFKVVNSKYYVPTTVYQRLGASAFIEGLQHNGLNMRYEHLHQGESTPDSENSVYHAKTQVTISVPQLLWSMFNTEGINGCLLGQDLARMSDVTRLDYRSADVTSPPAITVYNSTGFVPLFYSGAYFPATSVNTGCHYIHPLGSVSIMTDSNGSKNVTQTYNNGLFEVTYQSKPKAGSTSTTELVVGAQKPWYIAIPVDKLLAAVTRYKNDSVNKYFGSEHRKWTVPTFPIEDDLLDLLYEELDRPSFNAIASIFDVVGGIKSGRKLGNIFKNIKSAGGIRRYLSSNAPNYLKEHLKLKTASDLYLTKKYIYDTTRMDIEDFFLKLESRLSRPDTRVSRYRFPVETTVTDSCVELSQHCVRVHFGSIASSTANVYGFDLGMEAIWDMIPYSFVVDWFCGIGDCLSSIEMAEAVVAIPIQSCTESIKKTYYESIDDPITGMPVLTTTTLYRRDASQHLPPIYPSSLELSNPFLHLKEGLALLVSHK